jgi:hypothetical protein
MVGEAQYIVGTVRPTRNGAVQSLGVLVSTEILGTKNDCPPFWSSRLPTRVGPPRVLTSPLRRMTQCHRQNRPPLRLKT